MPTHRTFLIVAATLLLVMLGIAACVPAGPQAEAEMEEQPMLSMEPAEEQVLRFAPVAVSAGIPLPGQAPTTTTARGSFPRSPRLW